MKTKNRYSYLMRNRILFILLLTCIPISLHAQTYENADVIFLPKGEVIFPDKIIKINSYKMIEYELDGEIFFKLAEAVVVHGTYVDLDYLKRAYTIVPEIPLISSAKMNYNGKNYLYYLQLYDKGLRYYKSGRTLSIIGISIASLGGLVLLLNNDVGGEDIFGIETVGSSILITCGIILSIGLPILIKGISLKTNNKRAMDQCHKSSKVSFSFGVNQNGVGLALRF